MRRLTLCLLAVGVLLGAPVPSRAQITTEQLNKLSLEALTAPPPRPTPRRHLVSRPIARHFGSGEATRYGVARQVTRSQLGHYGQPRHRQIAHR